MYFVYSTLFFDNNRILFEGKHTELDSKKLKIMFSAGKQQGRNFKFYLSSSLQKN